MGQPLGSYQNAAGGARTPQTGSPRPISKGAEGCGSGLFIPQLQPVRQKRLSPKLPQRNRNPVQKLKTGLAAPHLPQKGT